MKKYFTIILLGLLAWSCKTTETEITEENLQLRTTFEETVGVSHSSDLSDDEKKWLVSLPAIIMSANKSNLETLEVETLSKASEDRWKKMLSRDWGIESRDELLETIGRMEYDGHNDSFLFLSKLMIEYDYAPLNEVLKYETLPLKKQNYYTFILSNREEYESLNLIAWDLGRMTSLIRWGYQVGFLTEEESWNMLSYFGKKIQMYYTTWEEYGEAYNKGRILWASGFGKEDTYREKTDPILSELLGEAGLWTSQKWNIKLSEPIVREFDQQEIMALEDEALKTDLLLNVSARKYKSTYITLGNIYLRQGDLDKAELNFSKGLKLDAKDWETQLRMSKIEYVFGRNNQAAARLSHLHNNCNDPIINNLADTLSSYVGEPDELVVPDNYGKVLLVHQYDYIPDNVMDAVKSRIEQDFKIRVWTGRESLALNEANMRTKEIMLSRHINRIVTDFKKNRADEYREIRSIIEVEGNDELNSDQKYAFVRYLYFQSEEGKQIWSDLVNRMTPQYDADVLRDELMKAYGQELNKENVIGVLGLTM